MFPSRPRTHTERRAVDAQVRAALGDPALPVDARSFIEALWLPSADAWVAAVEAHQGLEGAEAVAEAAVVTADEAFDAALLALSEELRDARGRRCALGDLVGAPPSSVTRMGPVRATGIAEALLRLIDAGAASAPAPLVDALRATATALEHAAPAAAAVEGERVDAGQAVRAAEDAFDAATSNLLRAVAAVNGGAVARKILPAFPR
jgi:hypothetical protein